MVERSHIKNSLELMDQARAASRVELEKHLGHLDGNALAEVMRIARDAHKDEEHTPIDQLHRQLADKMLIVGGDNGVAKEQIKAVLDAYQLDQEAWDWIVSMYEREQGENHEQN